MCLSPAPTRRFSLRTRTIATARRTGVLTKGTSGLGLGICRRLIDDFLASRPATAELTLLFTTRSATKASETLKTLQAQVDNHSHGRKQQQQQQQQDGAPTSRVHIQPERVELASLVSVRDLAKRLLSSAIPKLDAIVLNAGATGLLGLNWPLAIWSALTDTVNASTWPQFKVSAIGLITEPQLKNAPSSASSSSSKPDHAEADETPVGQVFCSNVFGHYVLVHALMSLFRACPAESPAKIVWVSSVEVAPEHFNPDDLQGFVSPKAYEHSKRLTDILVLTSSNQAATARSVESFMKPPASRSRTQSEPDTPARPDRSTPTMYLSHPGVCNTTIVPLPWIMQQCSVALVHMSRWIGSPWATSSTYVAALSATWLVLASPDEIDARAAADVASGTSLGAVKWGSAVDRRGRAFVAKTDVEGWGLDGSGAPFKDTWFATDRFGAWGRRLGVHATDATEEDVQHFVELGARVWREMEALRVEWEARLDRADTSASSPTRAS